MTRWIVYSLWFIVNLLALTGCDRLYPGLLSSTATSRVSSTAKAGHLNVLAMGQSNMVAFSPDGQRTFEAAVNKNITFINCAVGGTYIREWMPGTPNFGACMAAMADADVVLWYQGEADTQLNGDYTIWAQEFTTIAREIQRQYPNVLIIYAQLAGDPDLFGSTPIVNTGGDRWLHWDEIKAQQSSVSLPRVTMIHTDDLPAGDDHVHLVTSSYQEIGRRFARIVNTN